MPPSKTWLIDSERELEGVWWCWCGVQSISASSSKECAPHIPILDKVEPRVNFKEDIVIKEK
jgi:hypothetical protein